MQNIVGVRQGTQEEKASYFQKLFQENRGFNGYFHGVEIVYRIAEFAFLFLFLGFLAISALGNLSGITYANAEYLFRNFSMTLEENRSQATELVYSPDTGMCFASAGKGFAVCGNTGVSLFSATGRNTCTLSLELHNPCLRSAGSFTLVFESNGTSYYIFGPYSLLFEGTAESPIRGGSMAENGNYALISAVDGYTSAVTVYDGDFSPVTRYKKNDYVVSAELNVAGDKLVITSLTTDADGTYVTEITEYTPGKTEADSRRTVRGVFPLQSVPADGCVWTVCADRLLRKDSREELMYPYEDGTVVDFSVGDGDISVLLKETKQGQSLFRLLYVDKEGKRTVSDAFAGEYCREVLCEGRTWLLTDRGLGYFENGTLSPVSKADKPWSEDSVLLAYSRNKVYLAGKSAAYLLEVN